MENRLVLRDCHRVLVLRSVHADDVEPHERFHAMAIELNTIGRGAALGAALADLVRTVSECYGCELYEGAPFTATSMDPDLVRAFDDRAIKSFDGHEILQRLRMRVEITLESNRKRTKAHARPNAVFERDLCPA